MSDTLPVVQPLHKRSDMLTAVEAFHEAVNKVIDQAIKNGLHSNDRVLLLLTETDPDSGYGFGGTDKPFSHSFDGHLIMPFGKNEQGQKQFLISFDPSSCNDTTHPDLTVPPGWNWEIYNPQKVEKPEQAEQPQIVIVLTREKQPELNSLANSNKGEIAGFNLVKMPDLENFEQFAIIVDQSMFTVQIRTT